MSKKVRISLTETAVIHYDFAAEISDSDFAVLKRTDNITIPKWDTPEFKWQASTLNAKYMVLENILDSITPDSNVEVEEVFLNVSVTYNENNF